MNIKKIIRNISYTFTANFIALGVSLFSTLVLPKLMGVRDYGYWQLYLLYISYAGLFHFGICDGIYLKNGGKDFKQLDHPMLGSVFRVLVFGVIALELLVLSVSYIAPLAGQKQEIIFFTCVGAFFHVIKTYFLLLLQTTNRLREYSFLTVIDRTVFVLCLIVFFSTGYGSFVSVIAADILGRIVSLALALMICREVWLKKTGAIEAVWIEIKDDIKGGFPLLVSGVAGNLIIGIVRIGIERVWDIEVFGKVSLALSVANMFLSFVTMIGIVFFPILKKIDEKHYNQVFLYLNHAIAIISLGMLILAVPIKIVVSIWLPNYKDSMEYMILVMPICVFECISSILLNTYMKALRKERTVLLINILAVAASAAFTYILTSQIKNLNIAVVGIVLLLGLKELLAKKYIVKLLRIQSRWPLYAEFIAVPVYMLIFIKLSGMTGELAYIALYGLLLFFMRDEIKKAFQYFEKYLRRKQKDGLR